VIGRTDQVRTRERIRPFVGRARELEELGSAIAEADAGRGSLLLISGEPGIGKSRLMEELADDVTERGWRVLNGRCWEGGGAPAYWPWVQVVREAGGEFDRLTPPDGESGRVRADRSVMDARLDPDAARFRLFDEVGRFLDDLARERPCLIVLDDLHAADEPSLLLLRFLATTGTTRPVVVVGSYRENEPRVVELADVFGELARLGRRIPLRGLSEDEVVTFVGLMWGDGPPASLADRVYRVTNGNPFFVGEVVRALIAEGWEGLGEPDGILPLPEEVRVLIRRRLAGLSPEAVISLRAAAVIGREFDLRVLSSASTLSLERLIGVLAEATRAAVVSEDPNVPTAFSFTHDLVRETLYEDLPSIRRMELHRTVGEVLVEAFRDDLEPHLPAIAHHFSQSAPLGDVDRAVDYAVRAGDQAAAVLAYEDAALLYARAVQLLPRDEAAAGRRCEILLRLGDVRSRSGDAEDARADFEEAAAIASRAGAEESLAHAALGYVRSEALVRLGFGGLLLTAIFESGTTGAELLEEALAALPEDDGPLRARVLARLATELYMTDQTERRSSLSQEAVDMALRLGDAGALIETLQGRHWGTLAPESVHARLANANRMLDVAVAAGDDQAASLARHARLHCFLELFDVAGVDREVEAIERLARRIRQPFYVWHAASLRGMRSLLDGRLAEAEERFRTAFEIARVRESECITYMFENAQIVAVRWAQGRLDEVRDRIRTHSERFGAVARWRDALVAAELGDERAARAEIERHARNDFADLPRDGLWILHLCALAQACVLVHDERRAATLYELLGPYADRNAVSVSTLAFGPVAMRLGMLAGLLERWEEADAHLLIAQERCHELGARAIEAMVMVERAKMHLARRAEGDADRARDALERAASIGEELNLTGILDRIATMKDLTPSAPDDQVPASATFHREGEYWTVAYEDEMARLRDLKGLRYLASVLSAPGRELHVLELVAAAEGTRASGDRADGARDGLTPSRLESTEPILDAQAKESYRRHLRELADDLEEARAWNDPERAARIEREIDAVTTQLERSLGLGGHDRTMTTAAERARVSVTKAIGAAIRAVSRECPKLGEHLSASIRTGRLCSYAPPGQRPLDWEL
jgi:tetratricopeptide (TPR) repeat protein